MTEQFWWYVARSSGIVALVLAAASVIWGLLLSTKVLERRPGPRWLLDLHRWLGGCTVASAMWRFGGDSSSPALARVPLNGSARSGCQASTCQTERARVRLVTAHTLVFSATR